MDPLDFLNKLSAMVSLHRWSEHVESTVPALGPDSELPLKGATILAQQAESGTNPKVYQTEDAGHVVIVDWGDSDDPLMRLVCWAECGENKFMGVAALWWKVNNPAWQNPPEKAP